MSRYRRLFRVALGRGRDVRRDTDEEIETHLALRTERLTAEGMDPAAARAEAERRFGGGPEGRRRVHRSARRRDRRLRRSARLTETAADIRLAIRQARRHPGHAFATVGIYAVAITMATSMFAVFDHVLLRALPYPDPDRLVSLQSVAESGTPFDQTSMANWVDWRSATGSLASTALYRVWRVSAAVGSDPLRATAASVSGAFFRTIRPPLIAGRGFTEAEGQDGAALAVVSTAFADAWLGGPADALGRTISVSGRSHEIVGVVDAGRAFPEGVDLWTPERWTPGSGGLRNNINYQAVARLVDGRSRDQARAELDAIARGIRERDPEAVYSWGGGVLPLQDVLVSEARPYLGLLMAAVLGVLLVACANLAGLALARSRARRREVAVRLALGSGRGRLARQLLTEHAVIATAGGSIGVLGSMAVTAALAERVRLTVPRADAVTVDLRVALFALALSLLAGLVAGALPSLRDAALDPNRGLGSSRGVATGGRGLPGSLLVGAEVALALTLLIGGGLLLRSFGAVLSRDLGYDPEPVVTAEINLVGSAYPTDEARIAYWSALLETLSETPGVRAAAIGNWIPTGGSGTGFIELPDDPDPDFGAGYRVVSEAYFDALGMRLLEGRTFGAQDASDGERVVIVNASLAARAWPRRRAIGQRIRATSMESWLQEGAAPWLTVVGVVADVRHGGFEFDPSGEMYVLHRQVPAWTTAMTAVVRSEPTVSGDATDVVRERTAALDRSLALEVGRLDRRVLDLLAERRLVLAITIGFALAAVLLASLGVYGLVSFATARRKREMAIRSALGAGRTGLVGTVLGSALRVVGVGALVGMVVAGGLSGLMDDLLVDVTPLDPMTYAACASVLVVVGLSAALAPALRAARADPASVLTDE